MRRRLRRPLMSEPPPKPAGDDPGPPVLHRGKPADVSREHAAEPPAETAPSTAAPAAAPAPAPRTEAAENVTLPPAYREADEVPVPESRPQPGDNLVRKAAAAAFDFTEGLPNYVCQFFGGMIWAVGMTLNIAASGQASPAVAYGLGQGATLVAALWGVFVRREFRNAPRGTKPLLTLMFLCFIVGWALVIVSRLNLIHHSLGPLPK